MASWNRKDFLVSKGDLPVMPAGQQIFKSSNRYKKNNTIKGLKGGQYVFYDNATEFGDTLDSSTLLDAGDPRFGVGVDTTGDGLANYIQHLGGGTLDFKKHKMRLSEVVEPTCGQAQIVDVKFDCTKAEEVYSLMVLLDDYYVRSRYQFNEQAKYVFSVPSEQVACDSCETPHDCTLLAEKFVEQINGNVQLDPEKFTYFRLSQAVERYQPFSAAVLYPNGFEFCLATNPDDCTGNCTTFQSVLGISIDGQVVNFEDTYILDDPASSVEDHMSSIIDQANQAFKDLGLKGSVVEVSGGGSCCDKRIRVTSQDDVTSVELISGTGPLAPCDSFSNEGCGITIITHPVDTECICNFPPNKNLPNTFIRRVDVQAVHSSFDEGSGLTVEEVQSPTSVSGLGVFYQDRLNRNQTYGGDFQRTKMRSLKHQGNLGLPAEQSRANGGIPVDCGTKYIVLHLEHGTSGQQSFTGSITQNHKHLGTMLIPQDDVTTLNSLLPELQALVENSGVIDQFFSA